MKKAWLLLALAVIIAAQWSFMSSFYEASTESAAFRTINAFGTSAVVVAKANYVSVRVKFFIIAEPGRTALLLLPDGSQKNVTSSYEFEVFLPKTGSFIGSFVSGTPVGITLTDRNPIGVAVVSNVTERFFSDALVPDPSGLVTLYWFKVQGRAEVSAHGYGVAI